MLFAETTSGAAHTDLFAITHNLVLYLTFLIVATAHLAELCYRSFGWPQWLVNRFEKKERESIRRVLEELGFDESRRRLVRAAEIKEEIDQEGRLPDVRRRCLDLMRDYSTRGDFDIGATADRAFPYYVDLMAASLDPDVATYCARILVSYLKTDYRGKGLDFDVVVGLKEGSPIIACEFAKLLKKPAVLYRGDNDYKYNRAQAAPGTLFDGGLAARAKAVVVDDSTTGGRKVLESVAALRAIGCEIAVCLVLFEPLGKGARGLLREHGVELISVVTMDNDALRAIGVA